MKLTIIGIFKFMLSGNINIFTQFFLHKFLLSLIAIFKYFCIKIYLCLTKIFFLVFILYLI